MARLKQSIIQRDMRLGETRPELLERLDTELRGNSLQGARNVRSLSTGGMEGRDGTIYRLSLSDNPRAPIMILPADGLKFGLVLSDNTTRLIDASGKIVQTFTNAPWSRASDLWVVPLGADTIIGNSAGIWTVTYSDGVWSFGTWSFDAAVNGEVAQPYWAFKKGVSIAPSGYSGAVDLIADAPAFLPAHVGQRIRYLRQEIAVTEYVSETHVRGTVVNKLPPSYQIELSSTDDFKVGDVVVGADTNYQGVISSITSPFLFVTTLSFFEGPDVAEKMTSSSGTTGTGVGVVSKVQLTAPLGSSVWDEPMIGPAYGFPRSGAVVSGRLVLADLPAIPNGIALSSARSVKDFEIGTEDDDGIARQIGPASQRILHAVEAGDLLLFTDAACYLVTIRGNGLLTPTNFNPELFDRRGSSDIEPVSVGDGVVFVERNSNTVSAALLDGNVYLKWSIRPLTEMHSHIVTNPTALCGPALDSVRPEKYVFVVNDDGTLAAVSFSQNLLDPADVGITRWDTDGTYRSISPAFGTYWSVVDRTIDGSTVTMLESFESGVYLDSAVVAGGDPASSVLTVNGQQVTLNGATVSINSVSLGHLVGKDVYGYASGFVMQPQPVTGGGLLPEGSGLGGTRQFGLNFEAYVRPWPVEQLDSRRIGVHKPRCIRFLVSLQDSDEFQVRCNNDTRNLGGFRFGADLTHPPATTTDDFAIPVFGRRHQPDLRVIKHQPGRFRVLYTGQEVQV